MKTGQLATKFFSLVLSFVFLLTNSGFAQMIVTDGRTDTTVTQHGNTYDINTSTVSGNTGFNSFSKFDVYENTTANMYLPDGTQNLVNLVNGPQSNINGVLNAYKNGQIGGNVFFLNPNGIIIGANGIVNVGSLTLMTPTKEFMESVLNEDKTASSLATQAILAGDLPIDSHGLISVKGKIKAVGGVGMLGGKIRNDGQIVTNFNTQDIVNTAGVPESDVLIKDGKIVIKAQEDFVNTGVISADAVGSENAGEIDIQGKNISLESGSISANAHQGNGGKVTIFAQDKATFEKEASLSATSQAGDGGFIELSAEKEVALNGGSFAAAGGTGKKNGKVFIDPENLTISSDVILDGADYEATADNTLTVNSGITIQTTATGAGNSGDISLSAKDINIEDNVVIDASVSEANAQNGYTAGDVTIKATNEDKGTLSASSAEINIGENVSISGKNVEISAESITENPFDTANSVNQLRKKILSVIIEKLSKDSLKVVYLDSSASAKVNIGSGVTIAADNDISVSSTAKNESRVKLEAAKSLGVVILSDTQSAITVAENAVLSAGGNLALSASAENKISAKGSAVSSKEKGHDSNTSIALMYGELSGKTQVSVAQNTQLNAGNNVALKATTTLENSVSAETKSKDSSFAGAAIALAFSEVENEVYSDGKISAKNVEITSSLASKGVYAGAKSGVSYCQDATSCVSEGVSAQVDNDPADSTTNEPEDLGNEIKIDQLENDIKNKKTNENSGVKLALGAGVTYIDYDNTATAKVGGHSDITATENVKVNSSLSHEGIRQSASAFIDSGKANKIQNAAAAALNIASHEGTSVAGIEDGAIINLGGALEVAASYVVPYETSFGKIFETKDPKKIYKDLKEKGLQNGFVSVFSQSGISDKSGEDGMNLGIAGTAHVTDFVQNVNAYIGAAKINQNIEKSDSQEVKVSASSNMQLVNLGGMWQKGLGGSYIQNSYDSNVNAEIKDDAKISTSALSVTSELDQIDVTIGLANAQSKTFGFEGVFNWLSADNDTTAHISKNADINVRGDKEGDKLVLSAIDNSNFVNIAGAVLHGENTGVGASVAITDLNKNTQAYIGDTIASAATEATGSLSVDTEAKIQAANEGNVIGLTLAGAVSKTSNKQQPKEAQGGNGAYGIGISGDVVYSNIDTQALAYANNVAYAGNEDVSFSAWDDHSIYNVAGSLGIGMGGQSVSTGIAGAVTEAAISNDTTAEILNSSFDNVGNIGLEANSYSDVFAAAASGSGATSQGVSVAVAGSVSVNKFDNNINAAVVNSDIDADNLDVKSKNDSKITTVAGAAEYSGSNSSVGVGASVTHNDINNTTKAFSQDSQLTLAEKASFSAQDTSHITAVAGTAGVSTGLLAMEASLSINSISNDVLSYVQGGTITSKDDTEISAKNTAGITSVAGQLSLSGNIAVGASAATNKIRNNTKAYAENAQVNADNVFIHSDSDTDITTSAAGVSASKGNVSVAGSVAVNDIDTETSAFTKSSTINADGSIGLLATVANDVSFYGGNLAGSNSVGAGATVAVNNLRDRAYSYAQDSTLNALGKSALTLKDKNIHGVGINTYLDDHFKEIIINGALGIELAGIAGTVDVNTIENEAESYITNSNINISSESTSDEQSVDVYAQNNISSEVYGGSLGVSGNVAGVGAVSEVATIKNNTYAGIKNNSVVNAKKSVNVQTSSQEDYDSILVAGAGSGQIALAGAVNVARLEGNNKAEILQSDVYAEDVTVQAEDEANLGKNKSVSVGSAGIGVGLAGIGGSVLVTNNQNETTAQISSSQIDAEKDLKVSAVSTSNLRGYLPTGGAGLSAGIAASVAVNTINTKANAFISDSVVNDSTFATTDKTQQVEVSAASVTNLDNVVASLGAGLAGVGAAVAVNNIHNSANAGILNNSSVKSTGDIVVESKSNKNASSVSAALGAGKVGLSGSVSVLNIGGATDNEALSNISDAANVSNTEIGRNKNISAANLGNNGYFADIANTIHEQSDIDVSEEFSASLDRVQGTSAFVDGSSLVSDGATKINAEDTVTYSNIAGGTSLGGLAAVGASVATANIESNTSSFLGDNSRITSGKDLVINSLSHIGSSSLLSFIGTGSLFGSLSAVVAGANEKTNALSTVGKNAVLTTEEDIQITSKTFSDTHTQTVGATAGGVGAVGVSVSKITKSGTSGVFLDDNAQILQGNVTAMAYTNADNYAEAEAGSGGIVTGTGTKALVENNDKLYAKTGQNVTIDSNTFTLGTQGNVAAKTKNIGVSLSGLTIGVGVGQANIHLDNVVEVGKDNTIISDDTKILAQQEKTQVRSEASGGSGSLVGGYGVNITDTIDGNVITQVQDGTTLKGMLISVGSDLHTDQEGEANYYNGSVAGVGGNVVNIYNKASAITQLGNGLTTDAQLLKMFAFADNRSYANVNSGSGGVLDVPVGSGKTDTTTSAKLLIGTAGSDKTNNFSANEIELTAHQTNKQDTAIDMFSIGVISGNGMSATNNSNQTAMIDLEGINNITADTVEINALNDFKKDIVTDQNMYYRGGGGVQISVGDSTTNIRNNTDIIFGDNTSVLATSKDSSAALLVNAFNDLQAKDYIKLNAGALIETPILTTKIENNGHANITVNKASLKTYGNSVFNAKTDLDLDATTNMSIYGVAGIAHGVAVVNSTNTNNVTLNAGADVFSLGNTNIGLTQPINVLDFSGKELYPRAEVNLLAKTQIWNRTVVPVSANSYAKVDHKTTDNVNIQKGATLRSGTNVNIDTGTPIEKSEGIFDYVSYLDAVAASNKTAQVNSNYYSKVNNNGVILAGSGNRQYITAKTLEDGSLEVNVSDPDGNVAYFETEESLVNNLIAEIEKYQDLKQQYSASDPLAQGYQEEIDRLMDELRELQLVEKVIDPDTGEEVELIKKVSDVKFLTFADFVANHGDISINASDLNGSGTIEARGSSVLSIINDSDRFLRLNDVKINNDATGTIYFNSFAVTTPEQIRDINKLEKNVGFTAEKVKTDYGKAQESVLTIASTYDKGGFGVNTELNGSIENLAGKVHISTTGSIYAKGNIRATSVEMAANKNIVQYMIEGFRHVGGDPSKQWESVASAHEKKKVTTDTEETPEEPATSSIIGNNIFISGRYLNLNGLVQSGTADFSLHIDDTDIELRDFANVAEARADYESQLAAESAVLSPLYKLSDKYGSLDAYYNVLTDKIEVNDVQIEGGHMELVGHILNTSTQGNGELRVLDGYGQVDIVNNSAYDLVINSFDTSKKVEGYLKITDLAKQDPSGRALETIYTRVNGQVQEVNSMTRDENGKPNNLVSNNSSVYNPLTGQRYKWMTGQETLKRDKYYREESYFWGFDRGNLTKYNMTVENVDPSPLDEGYLIVLDDTDNSHAYSYTYEKIALNSPVITKDSSWTTSSGFWIFSTKTYHHEVVKEQGQKNYHTHSIKADNPIKINFGGNDEGKISIVSNNSSVLLNGLLNNPTGTVTVTSANNLVDNVGSAKIVAKDINLAGKAGIGVSDAIVTSLTGGLLTALSQSGDIALRNIDQEFQVSSISAANGTVNLTTSGNIINHDATSLITAKELILDTASGIGSETDALNISTGKIHAQAVDDINLRQTGGDLGVDFISSETGDIMLTADGNVYDASEDEIEDSRTLEEKMEEWNEMELFEEAGWTKDQLVYAVNYRGSGIDYEKDTTTAIPSIVASKITIHSEGAVGTRLQETQIDISEGRILTEAEKKAIANVPSSRITVDEENNVLIINNNKPIVLKGDIVNIEANNGIYLRQTEDNLKSDYIRNNQSGEVRLEVPTSNVEIKDLRFQNGSFNLVFGKEWHSLAYLFDRDIKAMTIDPTAAIIPQEDEISSPQNTIDNSLKSIVMPTYNTDDIVRTMSNLQASAEEKSQETDI